MVLILQLILPLIYYHNNLYCVSILVLSSTNSSIRRFLLQKYNSVSNSITLSSFGKKLEFDIFTYDYGEDGLPGDGFIDTAGDGKHQVGESLHNFTFNTYLSDCGLDGICEYITQPLDLDFDGVIVNSRQSLYAAYISFLENFGKKGNISEFDGSLTS